MRGRKGYKARNDVIAEQLVGLGLVVVTMYGISRGLMTGYGPDDEDERHVFNQTSQPFSALIGDTWFSYARYLEPFSLPLSIMATALEHLMLRFIDPKVMIKGEEGAVDEVIEIITDATASVGKALINKTMMANIRNLGAAIQGEHQALWRIALTGTVPSLLKWVARLSQDGVHYDPQTFKEYLLVSLPLGHRFVDPHLNIFGDPIKREKTSLPYKYSEGGNSEVSNNKRMILDEIRRLRLGVLPVKAEVTTPIKRGMARIRISLGREKFVELQKLIGGRVYTLLYDTVFSAQYARQDDTGKKAMIKSALINGRKITSKIRNALGITDEGDTKIILESDVFSQEDLTGNDNTP